MAIAFFSPLGWLHCVPSSWLNYKTINNDIWQLLKIYCPDSLSEDLLDDADAHSLMLQLVRDVRAQLLDLDVEKFTKRGLQCRCIGQTTTWLPAGWLAGDTPLSLTTLEPRRYTESHCGLYAHIRYQVWRLFSSTPLAPETRVSM